MWVGTLVVGLLLVEFLRARGWLLDDDVASLTTDERLRGPSHFFISPIRPRAIRIGSEQEQQAGLDELAPFCLKKPTGGVVKRVGRQHKKYACSSPHHTRRALQQTWPAYRKDEYARKSKHKSNGKDMSQKGAFFRTRLAYYNHSLHPFLPPSASNSPYVRIVYCTPL